MSVVCCWRKQPSPMPDWSNPFAQQINSMSGRACWRVCSESCRLRPWRYWISQTKTFTSTRRIRTTKRTMTATIPTEIFFNCAFLVLFDFPDFCCISAYMLLIVVWAEAYLKSRRHWLSSFSFRKIWMLIYFVFNTLLYTVQVTLYSLLFFPFVNNNIELTLIYLSLASFNIGLPVLWSVAYLYLAIMVSIVLHNESYFFAVEHRWCLCSFLTSFHSLVSLCAVLWLPLFLGRCQAALTNPQ